jgi:signal peptidase I
MSDDRTAGPPQSAAPGEGSDRTPTGPPPSDPQRAPKGRRPWWVEIPILVVVAFLLTFLIQTFVARVYYVPSGSMERTLHGAASGGDRILANKLVYDFRDPAQGDVVVFKGPPTWVPEVAVSKPTNWFASALSSVGSVIGIAPPDEKDYVKRVIAVGGQTVQCCDAAGNVTVDGRSLDEDGYIYQPIPFEAGTFDCTTQPMSDRCFGPVTVPQDQLWVMGDHRSDSADSSYQCQGLPPGSGAQCQGPVPVDDVIGKAVFIVLPASRWGTIGDPEIDPGG